AGPGPARSSAGPARRAPAAGRSGAGRHPGSGIGRAQHRRSGAQEGPGADRAGPNGLRCRRCVSDCAGPGGRRPASSRCGPRKPGPNRVHQSAGRALRPRAHPAGLRGVGHDPPDVPGRRPGLIGLLRTHRTASQGPGPRKGGNGTISASAVPLRVGGPGGAATGDEPAFMAPRSPRTSRPGSRRFSRAAKPRLMFGAAVGTAALLLAACSGSGTGSAVPAPAAPVSSTTTAAPTGSGATGPAPGPTTPAPAGSGPSTTGATGKAAPPSYGQGPTASTKPTPGPGPSTASTLPPAVPARPGTITSPGIWVAGVDGSAPTRLPVEPEAGTGGGPAWSLDGHQIAYVGADHGLWVVGADGSGAHRIAAGPVEADVAEGAAAAWAADGTLLYA